MGRLVGLAKLTDVSETVAILNDSHAFAFLLISRLIIKLFTI